MSRPLLQLALDHTSLQAAQRDVERLADHVDIIEAGTICVSPKGLMPCAHCASSVRKNDRG